MEDDLGRVRYRLQYIRCGKPGCRRCQDSPGHGPYWYAAWREGNRVLTRYIGKELPPGVTAEALTDSVAEGAAIAPQAASAVGAHHVPTEARGAPGAPASRAGKRRGQGLGRVAAKPSPGLRIWVLGQFRVEANGIPVPDRAWRRQAAPTLLKLLLLADRHRMLREQVAFQLWPDADPETARGQLATAVYALRRALEPTLTPDAPSRYLRQEGVSLALHLEPTDWVDYLAFTSTLSEAATAADPLLLLEQAVALYGGELMPEVQGEWCIAARETVRLRWCGAMLALAEAQVAHRQVDRAAATLGRLLQADPANEEAARRLMGLLGRQGRRSEALHLYNRLRQALDDELEAEPAPETEALAEALRLGGPLPRRVQARAATPTAAEPPAVRPSLPSLVGRVRELAAVRAALLATRDGLGHALMVTGTAGIGKTRLAEEASTIATMLGFIVLEGRAAETEHELPYAPIAEALRAYCGTRPPAALRRDLAGAEAVRGLLPELARIIPGLAELPPLENPGAARLRLWTAVRTLLAAATAVRPVLLIVGDLQWADRETLGLLTFLVRRVRELRLTLLLPVRDDHLPKEHPVLSLMREGQRERTLQVLPLSALSPTEVGELAQQQIGATLDATQVATLHAQCAGNPFFVLELLALLREPDQETSIGVALGEVLNGARVLPGTIRQTLGERLDRLSPACRAALRIGAVIGERFPAELLGRCSELEPTVLAEAFGEAVAEGLLREEMLDGEAGYVLAHALLRRALYEEITPPHRRRLHAAIAGGLAERAVSAGEPLAAVIAYHLAQSEDHKAAALWFERAGDRAAGVHANAAALAHYRRASELLARVARAEQSSDALARLLEKEGSVRLLDGDYAAAQACFATARTLVEGRVWRAELWRKEAVSWEKRGDFSTALAALATAESEAGSPELPAAVRADLELSRGDVHWSQGQFGAAEAAAERALLLLRDEPEGPALARATYLIGHVAGVHGDYEKAERCYRQSLATRERIGDHQGIAACWYGLGLVAYDRGDPARAEECHRHSLAMREAIGDHWGCAFSWSKLAQVAQYQGRYAEAEEYNRQSMALCERIGSAPGLAGSAYQMGQVAHEHGDYAEAAASFERALRIQERIGDRWGCSNSLNDLGDVALERGDIARAEQFYRQSLAIKEQLGDQLGIGRCLHGLGQLARARGDLQAAAALGRRARRLAQRIGARGLEIAASLGQAMTALQAGRPRLAAPLIVHSRSHGATYGSAKLQVLIALADAALLRYQGLVSEAHAAAAEALRLAERGRFRREEALAQRTLGACALAANEPIAAVGALRMACGLLAEIGAAVELAHTQMLLAEALALCDERHAGSSDKEAAALRTAALACFATRGLPPGLPRAVQA